MLCFCEPKATYCYHPPTSLQKMVTFEVYLGNKHSSLSVFAKGCSVLAQESLSRHPKV